MNDLDCAKCQKIKKRDTLELLEMLMRIRQNSK